MHLLPTSLADPRPLRSHQAPTLAVISEMTNSLACHRERARIRPALDFMASLLMAAHKRHRQGASRVKMCDGMCWASLASLVRTRAEGRSVSLAAKPVNRPCARQVDHPLPPGSRRSRLAHNPDRPRKYPLPRRGSAGKRPGAGGTRLALISRPGAALQASIFQRGLRRPRARPPAAKITGSRHAGIAV